MKKYITFIFGSIIFFTIGELLPGDFLKYNMYSKDTAIINDIIVFKNGTTEQILIKDLDTFLYHRKIIDEAHPEIDFVGLKLFLKKYIKKQKLDSIHFIINNKKINVK
ncbi:hypothetical protein N9P84_04355 [Polaribacter sp.]|nr:hypothetical protein [Polaribacter sp.]